MIIFPCVANDTGRNIFHSVDPVQVVFRSVAPDCTTVIKCDINNQFSLRGLVVYYLSGSSNVGAANQLASRG